VDGGCRGVRLNRSSKSQWAGKKNCMMGFMNCTPGQILFMDYQIEASEGSMEGKYGDDNSNDKTLRVSSTHLQRCAW
jgi:hypothetical protein